MSPSANIRSAIFMSVSMAGFTMNDAMIKIVSQSVNMGQVMFVRGLFATILVTLLAWYSGALANPGRMFHPVVAVRVVAEAMATITFLLALQNLPIATVSAILQALPLAVTMGAALFFSEPVGWRRWLAITAGFTGVLIVVRPGADGFNVFALMALLCVFFCTIRDLSTKRVPDDIPSMQVSVATATVGTFVGAFLIVPFGGWKPLAYDELLLLAGAAALLIVGYQFIIMSLRGGDISFVAPFRYTGLLWAILLGFLVFGDIPDTAMAIGATVVVASGLYAFYRERVRGRELPAAKSTSPAMAPDGL